MSLSVKSMRSPCAAIAAAAVLFLSGCGGGGGGTNGSTAPYLLLSASNGTNGIELWKSDGTAAGTVQVIDLNTGSANGMGLIIN